MLERILRYKGYVGLCHLEDDWYHGDVIGLRDVITFTGKTKAATAKAFRDSVNDYLSFCKKRGEKPEPPPKKMKCSDATRVARANGFRQWKNNQ